MAIIKLCYGSSLPDPSQFLEKMSEQKGNLKGLAISFILISLIMGVGVGIVYFVGQGIY